MSNLPWAYSDPIDGAGMDDEDRGGGIDYGVYCKHCGREMDWTDCDACGGEGEFDAYDSDPLWYSPGDTEPCAQCGGDGGWWWCDNQDCEGKK